jgi:phenylacetate-CoA ligase
MDLYGPLLAKALFPAFEAMRGRPTIGLLQYLHTTERWSIDALRDLQLGFLRRLLRHAYTHTAHFRDVMDAAEVRPEDFSSVDDLAKLPILDRETVRATMDSRLAVAPPFVAITKTSSGTTGEPVTVKYNAESRHWRDAARWRGYGWAGYQIGVRAMHYWGMGPRATSWTKRTKANLDHAFKRDLFVDCTPRSDAALTEAVAKLRAYKPHVIVAYSAGAGALARFVNAKGLRDWRDTPVIVGAERLWPEDRAEIIRAFGPAFESYGAREVQLMGSECEAHDGLHTSMEMLVVELIVREPDGRVRAARPGETGEVCVTDLHNLACPMIRYVTGDLAVAREPTACRCGRTLIRIGPIEGRVTETLHDGQGNPVSGLVFSILFALISVEAKQFQIVQHVDRSIVLRLVLASGPTLSAQADRAFRVWVAKYLPGAPFTIEIVDEIPLTAAGKRKLVIVES